MAGFYVDGIEICNIPIGKDDARGSPVWVFSREWPSGGKNAEKLHEMTIFSITSTRNDHFRDHIDAMDMTKTCQKHEIMSK